MQKALLDYLDENTETDPSLVVRYVLPLNCALKVNWGRERGKKIFGNVFIDFCLGLLLDF